MADVFISYDRVAHDAAALIAVKLRQLKIDVWFDVRARPEEAQKAKVVLVCWSRAAVTSEMVRDEAAIGQRAGKLIGCFLEQVALSPPFSPPQTENLANWNGQDDHPGWERLLQRIGERIGRGDLGAPNPGLGAPMGADRAGARPSSGERPPPRARGPAPFGESDPAGPFGARQSGPFGERRSREPEVEQPQWPEPTIGTPRAPEPPPPASPQAGGDPKQRSRQGSDPWGDTWARRDPAPAPSSDPEPPPSARSREPAPPFASPPPPPARPADSDITGPGGLKISFGIDTPPRGDGKRGQDRDRDRGGRGRSGRDERSRPPTREEPREPAREEKPKRGEFNFSGPGESSKSIDWFSGPASGPGESGGPGAEKPPTFSMDFPGKRETVDERKEFDLFATPPGGYGAEDDKPWRRRPTRGQAPRYARGGGAGKVIGIIAGLAIVGAVVFGGAYFATTYLNPSSAAPELDFASAESSEGAEAPLSLNEADLPVPEKEAPLNLRTTTAAPIAGPVNGPNARSGAQPAAPVSGVTTTAAAPAQPQPLGAPVVDQLKAQLRRLGLAVDGGEGVLGPQATASVRALQTAIGVRATGGASEALVERAAALTSCQMQRGVRQMSLRRPVNGAAEASTRAECCAAANLDARANAATSGLGAVRNWASACENLGTPGTAKLAGAMQGPARDNGTYTECQASAVDPAAGGGPYRCTVTGQVSCQYDAQAARAELVCE